MIELFPMTESAKYIVIKCSFRAKRSEILPAGNSFLSIPPGRARLCHDISSTVPSRSSLVCKEGEYANVFIEEEGDSNRKLAAA